MAKLRISDIFFSNQALGQKVEFLNFSAYRVFSKNKNSVTCVCLQKKKQQKNKNDDSSSNISDKCMTRISFRNIRSAPDFLIIPQLDLFIMYIIYCRRPDLHVKEKKTKRKKRSISVMLFYWTGFYCIVWFVALTEGQSAQSEAKRKYYSVRLPPVILLCRGSFIIYTSN